MKRFSTGWLQRRFAWLSPALLLSLGVTSCSRPGPDFSAADRLIETAVADGVTAGAVLLVGRGGEIVHEKAYGYARLYDYGPVARAEPVPMDVGRLFDLASLTKVFATTFGIMLLVEGGEIDLDAPLYTYLPDFRGSQKDRITPRHLLTHTAGLFPWKPIYYHADSAAGTYAYIRDLPLAHPVGEGRHYSDLGFMLLGHVIEAVTDEPLDAFLSSALYEPLGLQSTGFRPRSGGFDAFAATSHGNPFEKRMVADDDFGYQCDEDPEAFTGWRDYVLDGEVNDGNAYHANQGVAGHAGLFSTASDLHVLMRVLLDGGEYGGVRVLEPSTVEAILTPDATDNGLGWAMSTDVLPADELPPGAFGHTGFTGTYALAAPTEDVVVILLTNRQNGGVLPSGDYPSVDPLRRQVTALVLGGAEP